MRTVPVYTPDPDYIDRQLETELSTGPAETEGLHSRPAPTAHSGHPGAQSAT